MPLSKRSQKPPYQLSNLGVFSASWLTAESHPNPGNHTFFSLFYFRDTPCVTALYKLSPFHLPLWKLREVGCHPITPLVRSMASTVSSPKPLSSCFTPLGRPNILHLNSRGQLFFPIFLSLQEFWFPLSLRAWMLCLIAVLFVLCGVIRVSKVDWLTRSFPI